MNLEVTSVAKKEQKISQVAAAIFVITQEDIHRSGATSIPDLLHVVPGLDAAQINSNTWAISARFQFPIRQSTLGSGRWPRGLHAAVGGVFWETLDVPLEDIDRIGVIRGPGGTIWGANAVPGVINVITKGSQNTLAGLVEGGGGTQQQSLRYFANGRVLGMLRTILHEAKR